MPKMKTRSTFAKRVKLTKNGKVKFTHEGRRHKLVKANKTSKRKRGMRKDAYLDNSMAKNIRKILPY
jgi:large subunit ribosomal protein L35